jgi:branched-chain amino acid transport system ATP-binding protein
MAVSEHLDMGAWTLRTKEEAKEGAQRVYGLFPRLHERRNQKARTMSGG